MTTLTLTAHLDPAWNKAGLDVARATEEELRYRALLGDIQFAIGDADFSTSWGWVPVLDFVLGLNWLLERLPDSHYETFEFTESGAQLRFELVDDRVEVRSSYVAATAGLALDEFRVAVRDLTAQVLHDARQAAPGLDANPIFGRWAEQLVASF
jgi:hypothetical protein